MTVTTLEARLAKILSDLRRDLEARERDHRRSAKNLAKEGGVLLGAAHDAHVRAGECAEISELLTRRTT